MKNALSALESADLKLSEILVNKESVFLMAQARREIKIAYDLIEGERKKRESSLAEPEELTNG